MPGLTISHAGLFPEEPENLDFEFQLLQVGTSQGQDSQRKMSEVLAKSSQAR